MTDEQVVQQVRAFNRFYTRVIGVLQDGMGGTEHTLTEAHVLYELARREEVEVTGLRATLGLDAGYLSRILSRFDTNGLVVRAPFPDDARRQVVRLTEAGSDRFATLDQAQVRAVEGLLAPLDGPQRQRLLAAMHTVQAALGGAERPRSFLLRAPDPGDLGWVVERHGALYAAEYGWDATFEALVARLVADYAERSGPGREACWIAEVDGGRAGSVFCVADPSDPATAMLRMLLVEPSARGLGVGARLVDECLRFARRAGYARITLWTNDVLVGARRIYDRAGFVLDERERHRAFGDHDLVGERWSRPL